MVGPKCVLGTPALIPWTSEDSALTVFMDLPDKKNLVVRKALLEIQQLGNLCSSSLCHT